MSEYFTAVLTTVLLTGICAFAVIRADIEGIRSNWADRRCELPIMMMAGLLKPPEDTRSRIEFSSDNFSFCIDKIITNVVRIGSAPLVGLIKQQVNTTASFAGPINNVRGMISNGVTTFGQMLDKQYRQYSAISASVLKTWKHLAFAMGRIQGIVISLVYTGLSVSTLVHNFIDFMFKSITIFLSLLIVMLILLWFVLFPYIPLILSVIVIMVSAGVGSAAGMAGAFCIDPEANVILSDGKLKPLKEIKVGDLIKSNTTEENYVTGKLTVDTSTTSLVKLEGILMSGSHSIKYNDTWILAKDHPLAKTVETKLPKLICLNTSQHEVILRGPNNTNLTVSDWEEVSDEKGRHEWIDMVFSSLNTTIEKVDHYPTAVPLVSPQTKVISKSHGVIPIENILIGDYIYGEDNFTKVLGIYEGRILNNENNPEWISDGVWLKKTAGFWTTARGLKEDLKATKEQRGIFLVTEAEVFTIKDADGKYSLVRDFTEIGASQIDKTYDSLNLIMNKK